MEQSINMCFTIDILFEITNYATFKDFIHLGLTNKYFYENILKENKNSVLLLNNLLKYQPIFLPKELPDFLYKNVKHLKVKKFSENYKLIKFFKNLNYLHVILLPPNYVFSKQNNTLQELYIDNSDIQKTCLQNLNQLKKLSLCHTNIGYDECFKDLTNLTHFTIKWTTFYHKSKVTGKFFQYFKNLQFLELHDYEGGFNEYANELINLKELIISKSYVQVDPNLFSKLINLEILDISSDNFKKEKFIDFKQYFMKLKSLKLQKVPCDITDDDLEGLNLTELTVNNCYNLTGKFLQNMSNLTKLEAKGIQIEDKYLINLKQLQELNITENRTVTGKCLLYLTQLKRLIIDKTNIEDEYLNELFNLEYLRATDCTNIISGKFLFGMKKLNLFVCNGNYRYSKDIFEIRSLINQGNTLSEANNELIERDKKNKWEYNDPFF
ncbi:hypothetical protein ABK040_008999 [Willaertia magna]